MAALVDKLNYRKERLFKKQARLIKLRKRALLNLKLRVLKFNNLIDEEAVTSKKNPFIKSEDKNSVLG